MKKAGPYIVFGIVLLIIVYMTRGMWMKKDESKAEHSPNKKHDWYERYDRGWNYRPYDKDIVYETMKAKYGSKFKDITDNPDLSSVLDQNSGNSLYFSLVRNFSADSMQVNALLDFAQKGNDVFIATQWQSSSQLSQFLGITEEPSSGAQNEWDDEQPWMESNEGFTAETWDDHFSTSPGTNVHPYAGWFTTGTSVLHGVNDTSVSAFLCGKTDTVLCRPKSRYGITYRRWIAFDAHQIEELGCTMENIEPVSYLRTGHRYSPCYPNCIKIKRGKGNIYLMTTPIMLSNYFNSDSSHFQYINSLLASTNGDQILWDDVTRASMAFQPYQESSSYFRFILSNSALSKAFYFTCIAVLIYLILSIKRKQRPIPIMDQNVNSSLEFSHSIARLHYLSNTHKLMLNKKRLHFQSFVARRYGIVLVNEEGSLQKLASKSGVDYKYIRKLFNSYELADTKTNVSESLLMQVARLQDQFYSTCK